MSVVQALAFDVLSVDEPALTALLDQLDAAAAQVPAPPGVADRDQSYRARGLPLQLEAENGKKSVQVVHARALGRNSLTVLAAMKLPPKVACAITLTDAAGNRETRAGWIVQSQRLEQTPYVWDVKIGLHDNLDLVRYVPALWRAHVLVADDSPTICCLLRKTLAACHAEVTCVSTGKEAIEVATAQHFDLLMLDVEMPAPNGIEATEKLRKRGFLWPIVIVTATAEKETRFPCVEAGCDKFISKPPQDGEIEALVARLKPPPMISKRLADTDIHELIDAFVGELRQAVADLEAAFKQGDPQAIHCIARRVQAAASATGFPKLAATAERVCMTVENGFPISDLRRVTAELARYCLAARPARNFTIA